MGNSAPPVDSTYNFNNLTNRVNDIAGEINGQQTGITSRSDVLERGLIDMMNVNGLEAGDASAVRFAPSTRNPDTFFVDLNGVPQEQVTSLVNSINERYGAGTVRDTGSFEQFGNSLQFDLRTTMDRILPDLDNHLDTVGTNNPEFIRELQVQSGALPNFTGPNEDRAPAVPERPGKQGFGDITPTIEARDLLANLGTKFIGESKEAVLTAGGIVQQQQSSLGIG
jgi:hypothetical protein